MTAPAAETGTVTARFRCGRGAVDVHTDDATLAELAKLTHPFFTSGPRAGGERDVPEVWATDRLPGPTAWERLAYTSDFEPDRVLWVDHRRRRIAVVAPASPWRTQQLLRSVRNLARWQAYARGELFVHGGLVSIGGSGVAFLGRKRAGKTSGILSALVHADAGFVSNDDLVLALSDGGPVTGHGFPRTVNVRTDSLLALARARPALATLLDRVSHPANRYPGKQADEVSPVTVDGRPLPESLWVRCAELAEATGAPIRASHPVHTVVFPRFVAAGEPVGVDRLDATGAERLLREHTESRAVDFDPFLADWFGTGDTAAREATTARLLKTARFLRLRQHLDRMADATAALADDLRAAGSGGGVSRP
ncbi:hypothetical protein ACIRD2_27400 [Streptomyces sp. NPDC093595]|uniref:hypothetical protein n=1 Tax=Streptomyces sp. NPDC093595 TaxID=3366045 RepID=UPI00382D5DBF